MVTSILAGLLASGHYTFVGDATDDPGEFSPHPKRWDYGAQWAEDGLQRRFQTYAVADAVAIWEELKHRMTTPPE